jgi:hypothetical protein
LNKKNWSEKLEKAVTRNGEVPACPISPANHVIRCPLCVHYDGIWMDEGYSYMPAFVRCSASESGDCDPENRR